MTTAHNLLEQGIEALKAGRRAEARSLLAQIVQQDQYNETAWLWLSGAVDSDDQERFCLERVLEINPNNEIARRGLEPLQKKPPGLTFKKCPYCAEEILDEAIVCRHCGRELEPQKLAGVVTPKKPRERMYLQSPSATITSPRAIIGGKTYAMSHITSVEGAQITKNTNMPAFMLLLGLLTLPLAAIDRATFGSWTRWSILLMIVGLALMIFLQPKYAVRIGSSSGEVDALVSTDRDQIQKIVNALQEAIVERG